MAAGKISINFLEKDAEKSISESPTSDNKFRVFSKTPDDFLNHNDYIAPKYAEWTSGIMSCEAKKTLAGSEKPLYLKINDQQIGEQNIGKDYSENPISMAFDTTKPVITTIQEGNNKGYLTLAGDATWSCTVNLSSNHLYLKNPTIELEYNCPKYTVNLLADSTMGTVACINDTSSMEFDILTKNQSRETIITATPKKGYFFVKWDDGNEQSSRTIVLKESDLTSSNTQLTYTAIFSKKEMYVGSKRLDSIYVGSKKAKVYRGTTRIL